MNQTMDNELSPEQSLSIINQVLEKSKYRLFQNKFAFLFWGYFILTLALAHFTLLELDYKYHFAPWFLSPLGWIVMFFYYGRKRDTKPVVHFMGDLMARIWAVVGINILIVGFFGWSSLGQNVIGLIILLMSIGGLISGLILKFRPLIICSVLVNIVALLSIFLIPFEYHLLIMAASIILSCIIPGHLFPSNK